MDSVTLSELLSQKTGMLRGQEVRAFFFSTPCTHQHRHTAVSAAGHRERESAGHGLRSHNDPLYEWSWTFTTASCLAMMERLKQERQGVMHTAHFTLKQLGPLYYNLNIDVL